MSPSNSSRQGLQRALLLWTRPSWRSNPTRVYRIGVVLLGNTSDHNRAFRTGSPHWASRAPGRFVFRCGLFGSRLSRRGIPVLLPLARSWQRVVLSCVIRQIVSTPTWKQKGETTHLRRACRQRPAENGNVQCDCSSIHPKGLIRQKRGLMALSKPTAKVSFNTQELSREEKLLQDDESNAFGLSAVLYICIIASRGLCASTASRSYCSPPHPAQRGNSAVMRRPRVLLFNTPPRSLQAAGSRDGPGGCAKGPLDVPKPADLRLLLM